MKNAVTKKILPAAAWLIIWQLLAIVIHNKILIAGPIETVEALIRLVGTQIFWESIENSCIRILSGFLAGVILGSVLAFASYEKPWVGDFLKPLVLALKAVPVASFVILLLIGFGNRNISTIICAIVVFPIMYLNVHEGLTSADPKLMEMAEVYRIPTTRRLRYIFFPQLKPFIRSGVKLAIGMSFKSGIAAEVIGQPLKTMGNGLYEAKIYLETGDLFAWTIVIVLISFICEKILVRLFK
ncbi:MAG: ABC transporter permease subunit [Butyrivibrio sp.]|nr:ABC transporter permease subunit [Butyrivibrio sp.]